MATSYIWGLLVGGCLLEQPLLFGLAFDNGFDNREAAFRRLNGNNLATSCSNLVSLHPITSEFTLLKCAIFVVTKSQFDNRPSFGTLAFQKKLEYRNFDFRGVISAIISVHLVEIW